VSGDFNKDGFLDLVIANYSSNNLSALLGFGTAGFEDGNGNNYTGSGGQIYAPIPSFNFEDLGLALKVTPHVHGAGSVSLDLDSAVKMLSGRFINGLPVITNRQLTSQVDLPEGQSAVVAGLLTSEDAQAISGIPGLSQLPGIGRLLQVHTSNRSKTEALIMIKARLLSVPADEYAADPPVRLGSETRPYIPN
jgi:type II secretory pathway component GspD/PulD (secretin)